MEKPAESKLDPKQVRACLGIGPNLQAAFETLNKAMVEARKEIKTGSRLGKIKGLDVSKLL
jgi:hypothetical protein